MGFEDIHYEIANVGEEIGVQALSNGRVVGCGSTFFHEGESVNRGMTIVRGRVDVVPEYRRRGIGNKVASLLINSLASLGNLIHQEAFSESGQTLRSTFEQQGYSQRSDVSEVLEKQY